MKNAFETKRISFMLLSTMFLVPMLKSQDALPASAHYRLEKLADGIYSAIANNSGGYAICNAGIIDLGDRTVVADPFFSPVAARDLKKHAEYLTGKPVSMVLNLDPHSDHSNGNQVFAPGACIISMPCARAHIDRNFDKELAYYKNEGPAELLRIENELREAAGSRKEELTLLKCEYDAALASAAEMKKTLPDMTISDTLTIYGTKRKLVVIPMGPGHTCGDMVAYLPDDKIIFMSDDLFVHYHPYLADGDPGSLIKNLRSLTALNPAIAVPGHGAVGSVESLREMINYIETLTRTVSDAIARGTSEEDIAAIPVPDTWSGYMLPVFYTSNLKFLYHKMKP